MKKPRKWDELDSLYVAVTGDRYELPIAVAETAKELAKMLGVKENSIYKAVHRQKHGLVKGLKKEIKYYKIELEDDDGNKSDVDPFS